MFFKECSVKFLSVVLFVFSCVHAMQDAAQDPAEQFVQFWTDQSQQEPRVINESCEEIEWQAIVDDSAAELEILLQRNEFAQLACSCNNPENYRKKSVVSWLQEKALQGITPCLYWYLKIFSHKLASKESLDILFEQERIDLRFCLLLAIIRLRQDVACLKNVLKIDKLAIAQAMHAQWKAWFENFFKYEDDDQDLYNQVFEHVKQWFDQNKNVTLSPMWLCSCLKVRTADLSFDTSEQRVLQLLEKNKNEILETQVGCLRFSVSICGPLKSISEMLSKKIV